MIKTKTCEITKENLKGHEMIGLEVLVVKSSDGTRKGIEGKIVDETKETFRIFGNHGKGSKKEFIVPKKESEFEFNLNGEKVVIIGNEINKKPEDRVKEWRN